MAVFAIPDLADSIFQFLSVKDCIPAFSTGKSMYSAYYPKVWELHPNLKPMWTPHALKNMPVTWWRDLEAVDWENAPKQFGGFQAEYAAGFQMNIRVYSGTLNGNLSSGAMSAVTIQREPLQVWDESAVATDPELKDTLSDIVLLWHFNGFFGLPGGDGTARVSVGFMNSAKELMVMNSVTEEQSCCTLGHSAPFASFAGMKSTQQAKKEKAGPITGRQAGRNAHWEYWMEHLATNTSASVKIPQYQVALELFNAKKSGVGTKKKKKGPTKVGKQQQPGVLTW
eukprot:TRINITY_DN10120_c0_g1_i1.p1 TRINITY_DN10120_c0_g1~~TRINITY_DN10120_c0_g1_i1.p1  ORF type:complete len:295 (+),score=27.07 TRINITY_DN10120_c0_g1_i1:37-885(+)